MGRGANGRSRAEPTVTKRWSEAKQQKLISDPKNPCLSVFIRGFNCIHTAKTPATTSTHAWVKSNKRRRSATSAKAPAGSERRKVGRLVAVWTRATMDDEGL